MCKYPLSVAMTLLKQLEKGDLIFKYLFSNQANSCAEFY